MKNIDEIIQQALEHGFTSAGRLNISALEFMPEVRDMCAADRCQKYGRSWVCPPASGTLEEAAEKAAGYSAGVLLQSTGQLDDEFDIEKMLETGKLHRDRFLRFITALRADRPDCLAMSAGACDICDTCTYPGEPCRHPEMAIPSMEAYGLFVSRVCERSDLPYYYGKNTITYTSCVLVD